MTNNCRSRYSLLYRSLADQLRWPWQAGDLEFVMDHDLVIKLVRDQSRGKVKAAVSIAVVIPVSDPPSCHHMSAEGLSPDITSNRRILLSVRSPADRTASLLSSLSWVHGRETRVIDQILYNSHCCWNTEPLKNISLTAALKFDQLMALNKKVITKSIGFSILCGVMNIM